MNRRIIIRSVILIATGVIVGIGIGQCILRVIL